MDPDGADRRAAGPVRTFCNLRPGARPHGGLRWAELVWFLRRRVGTVAGNHAGLDPIGADRDAACRKIRAPSDLRFGARPNGGVWWIQLLGWTGPAHGDMGA